MADNGKLLAIGILFISALYLFAVPTNILIPTESVNMVDDYPYQDNWSANGTLTGNMVDNSGELTLSASGSGTYTSEDVYVPENSSLAFDNVVVNTDIIDTNDDAEIRIFGLSRQGVVQESENIQLQDGTTQYGLDERIQSSNEYSGYRFQVFLESTDNQEPSVNSVTLEYDEQKSLTNNSLAQDMLAWLLVLTGIGLIFL